MAEFPAMPFWFDAYWRDTQHLTYEEHGIYLHLISLLWHAPGQRIPADPKWLERRFKKHTPKALALLAEFCDREGSWFSKSKVRREFQYMAEKSEKQRERVKSRWENGKDSYRGTTAVIPDGYHPTPTPTPTKKKERAAQAAPEGSGNGHSNPEADLYRRGKEILGASAGGLIKRLLVAKGTVARARAALEAASEKQDPREYIGAMVRKEEGGGRLPVII